MTLITEKAIEGENYVKYIEYHMSSMIKAGTVVAYDDGRWEVYNAKNKKIGEGKTFNSIEAYTNARYMLRNYLNGQAVVWFNFGWFSSLSSIINSIHKDFEGRVKVLGTSPTPNITYKKLLDYYDTEPDNFTSPERYVEYALSICKKYKVDIFFPKKYSHYIAKNKKRFNRIGVTVICESFNTVDLLRSKQLTYQSLKGNLQELIPLYRVVSSFNDFKQAYDEVHSISKQANAKDKGKVVIKYDVDEGAGSFRIIDDSAFDYNNLRRTHENVLSSSEAFKIMQSMDENNKFRPLIVMEYMSDPEISVDCYMSKSKGFITVVRVKETSRMKQILATGELYATVRDYCVQLQKHFRLKNIFNVQFRWVDGKLKLLEINTRISGGIQLAFPLGINLPSLLIGEELGLDVNTHDCRDALLSQYETPILVDEYLI